MTTGQAPFSPTVSGHAREPQPRRHEVEFSRIQESLRGIQTTLEALRLEAERKVVGEGDDEPRDEGGRR